MSKHTPAQWEVDKHLHVMVDLNDPMKTITICKVYGSGKEDKANAQLIASAPELLEALKVMTPLCRLKYGNLDKEVYKEILKAEQAINKAEGKL